MYHCIKYFCVQSTPPPAVVYCKEHMLGLNKIIRTLIASDLIVFSAVGLLSPVFAIFIVNNIEGGDARVVGIAVGIYWITRSLVQIPIGVWLDRTKGEYDDFWAMVLGLALASITPIGYLFATVPWHLYALQAFHAIGMALTIPSWGGIFMRHIMRGKEAETWSVESASLGIGTGIAGIIGGIIVDRFGFAPIFIVVPVLGLAGAALLLLVKKDLAPGRRPTPIPHKTPMYHPR